ncbi:MAG TPA: tetratricopeptide repeat protein, partial [Candidatus Rifleibacterium sp.]|nr:tetratricopeptide repeat protein [Candidatus Rifleibacterium sp.]
MKIKLFCVVLSMLLLSSIPGNSQPVASESTSLSFSLEGVGEVILEEGLTDEVETTRLLLQKAGGARQVIDSFEGLLPADLLKNDLDGDGQTEIIAILKHPDGVDVMPFIYTDLNAFRRIFPAPDVDGNPIICRELFFSTHEGNPALCARNLIGYHDYGPPDLFRLELYRLQKGQLTLVQQGFSEGDHFNILMNKGAYALHNGQYLEALDYYNQAISSATGEIDTRAYVDVLFNLAEARKFTKDFKSALELYQRIVVEFSDNPQTETAQREIELIESRLLITRKLQPGERRNERKRRVAVKLRVSFEEEAAERDGQSRALIVHLDPVRPARTRAREPFIQDQIPRGYGERSSGVFGGNRRLRQRPHTAHASDRAIR